MLTSLQLWRNLKPLDLNQNLLGGFVLIPFFQVCFFILMYFDSFGDFSLHFWFRIKFFLQKHRKFSRNNAEIFMLLGNMRIDTIFCYFFGLLGKLNIFDEFRFAVRICSQTERQNWEFKTGTFLLKNHATFLSEIR